MTTNEQKQIKKAIAMLQSLLKEDTPELITIIDDGKKKTSKILDECCALFKVWSYWDNEELDKNFPPPKKPTKRQFAYTQEPDEEYKDMSANDLEKAGVQGITLRERLLFELLYWKKEGKHLDIKNITLCSGSRSSVGGVPSVRWFPDYDRLCVNWAGLGRAVGPLRSRAVVSC